PAVASVGRARVVQPALPAAREHHDRIRAGNRAGNLVLDVHLARHEPAVLGVEVLSADEEVALFADAERRRLRRQSGDESNDGERGRQDPERTAHRLGHRTVAASGIPYVLLPSSTTVSQAAERQVFAKIGWRLMPVLTTAY